MLTCNTAAQGGQSQFLPHCHRICLWVLYHLLDMVLWEVSLNKSTPQVTVGMPKIPGTWSLQSWDPLRSQSGWVREDSRTLHTSAISFLAMFRDLHHKILVWVLQALMWWSGW